MTVRISADGRRGGNRWIGETNLNGMMSRGNDIKVRISRGSTDGDKGIKERQISG